MTSRRVLGAILISFVALTTACSSANEPTAPTVATTVEATTTTQTAATTTAITTTVEPVVEVAPEPVIETTPEPVAEPYIVSCQENLGPVETYWSDGSVTGYSDYCKAQADQILRSEVEANNSVCDGTVCRYPSGATRPDTSANTTVRKPSPWVQGQIDWQNCIEAGNTPDYCRANTN